MSNTLNYKTISRKQRNIMMIGLALGLFAACFDATVTTTCGPSIANQFKKTELLPWLTTAYLLLETVSIPLSGKLSDLYGRKKLLMIGLVLFGLASLLAGFATSMEMVIFARAVQGVGGGILIPVSTSAVSDLYSPEERGKIQGYLGALYGIGMGAGPLIGGALASLDEIAIGTHIIHGWHFAFLINIPIVIIVFLLCKGEFPAPEKMESKPVIDFTGIALLSSSLIIIVLFFENLGKTIPIISWKTLIVILTVILLLKAFTHHEKKAVEPVIAPHVFKNPTVKSASILLFIMGFAIVADELFMGMYLQTITGHSPVEAGMYILLMVVGMMITSLLGGMMLHKTGIKPWVVAGPILLGIGFYMFMQVKPEFNQMYFCASELMFGLGAGCLVASLMTSVQNSCDRAEVGMTTSAASLMRNIGSTVGTSILTMVANLAIYTSAMEKGGTIELWKDEGLGILDHLVDCTEDIAIGIKEVFTHGMNAAYFACILLILFGVIVGLRFKMVSTRQTKEIEKYSDDVTEKNKKY